MVGVVSDREDMWRHLVPPLSLVHVYDLLRVDGQPLVGVDGHTEESRVRLRVGRYTVRASIDYKYVYARFRLGYVFCAACLDNMFYK